MKQIGPIQVLRALAALMVVFSHAQDDALNEAAKAGLRFVGFHAFPLATGVDLFFVISGFIMVYSSERLFATPGAGRIFIARRLARIVPLYWLITAIFLVMLAGSAWLGHHSFPKLSEIAASLGFIPYARPEDGQPRPIVSLGWTLNYEMFFYVIFALFLGLQRQIAVAGVVLTLTLVVVLGWLIKPNATALAYWSDPIVLEFVLGTLIAIAWQHGLRLRRTFAPVLIVIGLAILTLDLNGMTKVAPFGVDPNGFGRLFACGLPMALILGTIALADPPIPTRGRLLIFLTLLGDASYALYLFHPLAVILVRKAYLLFGFSHRFGFWPLIVAEIPLAVMLALAVHLSIEKPITTAAQKWLRAKAITPQPSMTKSEPLAVEGK